MINHGDFQQNYDFCNIIFNEDFGQATFLIEVWLKGVNRERRKAENVQNRTKRIHI